MLFWVAGKAFLRDRIIAYTMSYKKDKTRRFVEASRALRDAQQRYPVSRTSEDKKAWHEAKKDFKTSEKIYEQAICQTNTLHFHKYGNKAGKLLSTLIERPHTNTPIMALCRTDGSVYADPIEINTLLKDNYTALYAKDYLDPVAAKKILSKLPLSSLSSDQQMLLNSQISL